jgi:hypothetical protein
VVLVGHPRPLAADAPPSVAANGDHPATPAPKRADDDPPAAPVSGTTVADVDEELTVREAASRAHASTSSIYAWANTGKITTLRARPLRVSVSSLMRYFTDAAERAKARGRRRATKVHPNQQGLRF